jgi:hypothetical protein
MAFTSVINGPPNNPGCCPVVMTSPFRLRCDSSLPRAARHIDRAVEVVEPRGRTDIQNAATKPRQVLRRAESRVPLRQLSRTRRLER